MPQSALTRLIYASRRTDLSRTAEDEVRDILIASINNNRSSAITGLLMAHQDWFVQALEGPEAAVMETFGRISADDRHHETIVVSLETVAARRFYRWTMCARMMSDADAAIVGKLVEEARFDPFEAGPAAVSDLLTKIAELHGDLLTLQHTELMGEVLRAA